MAEKTLKVTAAQIEESVEKSHNHSNLSTLNNITSSRISEWDDKAEKEHRHDTSEIDGLDNLDVDLSNYYTKTQVDNKIATEIDSINLSSYAKKSEIPNATSDLTNDSNFATQTFVTNKIAEAQLDSGNVDLSGYATKDELNTKANISAIPTKTSQLTNDSNYLTAIPYEYVTETELETELTNKVDKVSGKGLSTNDLTNEMVTKINNAATQAYVTNAIAEAQLEGSDVDLSGLATKDELNTKADISAVPTKTSQLTNDSGFITTIPSEVITETELNAKSYATETFVTNKIAEASLSGGDVDLSGYATKDELNNLNIPTKTSQLINDSDFIKATDEIDASFLNGKSFSEPMSKEEYDAIVDKDPNLIYLVDDDTVIEGLPSYSTNDANKSLTVSADGNSIGWSDITVDLTDYYTKSEVEEKITNISTGGSVDLSSYATISYVDEAVNNIVIESGNISFRAVIEDEVFCVINEDNTTTVTYGSLIVSETALTVNENETTTFTIALNQAPTINQVVNISTANGNCKTDKNSLTFTSSNYATPQTITVTGNADSSYDNKTDTITISSTGVSSKTISVTVINTDVPVTLSSISATYTQGDTVVYPTTSLNELKQNLEVIATYSDSSTKVITNYELSGTLSVGTSTITVTFEEKTDTFNVIVSEVAALNSISATYTQGDAIIYTDTEIETLKDDLTVTANYSDGNSVEVTEYTLSGTLAVGTSTITVTYQGLTTTFNVAVSEKPVLNEIVATYTQGTKVIYADSDINDLKSNLTVTAVYSDGNSVVITDYELSGILVVGSSTITVTYQDKTTTFNVNVEERPVRVSLFNIEDDYVTIDTSMLNRMSNSLVERSGESTHKYFALASGVYSNLGCTVDSSTIATLHKEIEYAESTSVSEFTNGNVECNDIAYTFATDVAYYRIPMSAYTENNNIVLDAFASVIPQLSFKRDTNKTLTTYELTDEMIDTFTARTISTTATNNEENYSGFISMNPANTGISVNINNGLCSLTGFVCNTETIGLESWYVNVNGGRLQYRIPYGSISGDSLEELKAYLKANRLIFYIFS